MADDAPIATRPEDEPVPDEESDVDEEIRQLHESIRASREQIDASLRDIRRELGDATDWRGWVEDHPWEAVGTAFFAGFYLGFR